MNLDTFTDLIHKYNVSSVKKKNKFSSYVIKDSVCALCLCERAFPRKLAFAFLEDVAQEFLSQNGPRIESVVRPYHFIEFGQ